MAHCDIGYKRHDVDHDVLAEGSHLQERFFSYHRSDNLKAPLKSFTNMENQSTMTEQADQCMLATEAGEVRSSTSMAVEPEDTEAEEFLLDDDTEAAEVRAGIAPLPH